MILEEDYVSIGEPFSKHAKKARSIIITKKFYDLFNKLLMTSVGQLIRLSLKISMLERKIRLLALMEFTTVSTGVLVALVLSSSFSACGVCMEGVSIPDCFAESRTVLSPRPLTSMTMDG